MIDINFIVFCFVKLARNNSLIFVFKLTIENRRNFHVNILNVRFNILKLLNVENRKLKFRNNFNQFKIIHDKSSIANSQISCDEANTSIVSNVQYQQFVFLANEENNVREHLNTLSNYHIDFHFEQIMQKYDVI